MRISDWSSDVCSSDLIQGDFPAEVYPRTLLVVGVVLLGLQVAITLARGRGAALTLESAQLARTAALLAIMWAGYGLILLVGFVLAGAFLVFSYAWLLPERNRPAVVAAPPAPLPPNPCLDTPFRNNDT